MGTCNNIRSRDSMGRLQAEIGVLVRPRAAVVIGLIELCLSDLRRVDGDCRVERLMTSSCWWLAGEDVSAYSSFPFLSRSGQSWRSRKHSQDWRQNNHQSPLCWWHRWLIGRGGTGKFSWASRQSLHSLRHGSQCRVDQADDIQHQWHQHKG